jgi:hypothetical protein
VIAAVEDPGVVAASGIDVIEHGVSAFERRLPNEG